MTALAIIFGAWIIADHIKWGLNSIAEALRGISRLLVEKKGK